MNTKIVTNKLKLCLLLCLGILISGCGSDVTSSYPESQKNFLADLESYWATKGEIVDLILAGKKRDAKNLQDQLFTDYAEKWKPFALSGQKATVSTDFEITGKLNNYEIKDWICYVVPSGGHKLQSTRPCSFITESGEQFSISFPTGNDGYAQAMGGFPESDMKDAVYQRNDMLQIGDKVKFSGDGLYHLMYDNQKTVISNISWEVVETEAIEFTKVPGGVKDFKILK